MSARFLIIAFLFAASAAAGHADSLGVLIRFGHTDRRPTNWDGSISLSTGKIASLQGWGFEVADCVTGESSWKADTRPPSVGEVFGGHGQKADQAGDDMADIGVIAQFTGVDAHTIATVKTARGDFSFKPGEMKPGAPLRELNGAVSIERVPVARALTHADDRDHDFPAIASDAGGGTWVAWTSFTPGLDRGLRAGSLQEEMKDFTELAKPTGGDQVWLCHRKPGDEKWGEPLAVTPGKGDVMRCAVAVDGRKRVWIFYSDRRGEFFSIYARSFDGQNFSEEMYLTDGRRNDICPVAATDATGRVWVAWQGADTTFFRIYVSRQEEDAGFAKPLVVNEGASRNAWSPAIAATKADGGKIAVVWDGHEKGDYDVFVREFGADGKPDVVRPVANTSDHESRASIAYDESGRLWVAWEQRGSKQGGGLRVLDHGAWKEPAQSVLTALTGRSGKTVSGGGFAGDEKKGPRPKAKPDATRKAGEKPGSLHVLNHCVRIAVDLDGRIWLLCRTRQGQVHSPVGSIWNSHVVYYQGGKWSGPMFMPHTDNRSHGFSAITATAHGILIAHSSDHRQHKIAIWRKNRIAEPDAGNAALGATIDPFINDVFVSEITLDGDAVPPVLVDTKSRPGPDVKPADHTAKLLADIKAVRSHRLNLNGTELRILRGGIHRYDGISGDSGSLEDMWRHSLDVARMDWTACGDHDNGVGREYPWWLTQKTTDAYRLPGQFEPLFGYGRGVGHSENHRNVIFVQRGVRTLPRLPISVASGPGTARDTQMLCNYLRHFNGVCAGFASVTGMGADSPEHDPVVEPLVEICRDVRPNHSAEPEGFMNQALLKGCQFGFMGGDDGFSRAGYTCVYARENSRQAIFDAIKLRHTYAATDNIIADVTCRNGDKIQMMGDEFMTKEPPALVVNFVGTGPFKKVAIVKNGVEVHVVKPGARQTNIIWKDPRPGSNKTSFYYVRGEQVNGELVWVSPMWIKYEP